ncbi:hypothetical protein B0H14DRAFT_2590210 [Mycena olivaceomarginata]|nr:hypothetical protein B0H14DRAFT_2590210 [Mycena olivaceomarginata]
MATIVERPLSAFSDPMPSAVVPQRRRRDSVEIIDVDSFEETNTRPQQRRRVEEEPERNVIELLDSDDEPSGDSNVAGGSGASREVQQLTCITGSQRGFRPSTAVESRGGLHPVRSNAVGRPRTGRLAYRPRTVDNIATVWSLNTSVDLNTLLRFPDLENLFLTTFSQPIQAEPSQALLEPTASGSSSGGVGGSGATSTAPVPGPILASSRPFAFELDSSPPPQAVRTAGPSRTNDTSASGAAGGSAPRFRRPLPRLNSSDEEDLVPAAAPRARHNPPMGLGGALISYNNARLEAERADRARRGERRAAGGRVAPAVAVALAANNRTDAASGSGSGSGSGGNRIGANGGASGSGSRRANAPGTSIMRRLASLNPFRWGDGDAAAGEAAHHDVEFLALRGGRGGRDDRTRGDAQLALDIYLQDEDRFHARFAHPARGFARRELAFLRGWGGDAGGAGDGEEESYRREWTHPPAPDAGFVFDFAPPNEVLAASPQPKGKGKAKEVVIDVDAEVEPKQEEKGEMSTILVCARCLDPLLVRSDGVTDHGEERRKCYEELRRPPASVEDAESGGAPDTSADLEVEVESKGKGKGKGKAREEEREEEDELVDEDAGPSGSGSDNIRSRLRSRASASGSHSHHHIHTRAHTQTMAGAFDVAVPPPPPPSPPRRCEAQEGQRAREAETEAARRGEVGVGLPSCGVREGAWERAGGGGVGE